MKWFGIGSQIVGSANDELYPELRARIAALARQNSAMKELSLAGRDRREREWAVRFKSGPNSSSGASTT
jgi:hypothetical protein